jgi:acetyl-CoA carboxylase carboxyl transferase subunit alpha
VVDRVIPEPKGGAHRDPETQAAWIKEALLETLNPLMEMDGPSLVKDRHQKYARIGVFAGGD